MNSSAFQKLKRSISGKFLTTTVDDNEVFDDVAAKETLVPEVCKCPTEDVEKTNNEPQKFFRSTSAYANDSPLVCNKCNKLKEVKIHDNFMPENESFGSIEEDPASDSVLYKPDKNFNNLAVKMRSSSMRSSPSRHIMRRFSSPNLNINTAFPYGRLDSYENLGRLGEGSYAKVFKGKSKYSGELVALKEISLNPEEGTPFTAIREISLLKTLNHTNIVRIFDIIHTPVALTIVFEFISTDLSSYMDKLAVRHGSPVGINANNAVSLTYQLLRGLNYCHKRKILHRDLKPQNLLLSERGELKLADFGLARAKSIPTNNYSNEVVTLWYRPPDVLLGSINYNACLDMWGVGCIFLEMLTGMPMFPGESDACDELNKIFEVLSTPNPNTWPDLLSLPLYSTFYDFCFNISHEKMELPKLVSKLSDLKFGEDFAMQLLQFDPKKRLSACKAMAHPMFEIIPRKVLYLKDEQSIADVEGFIFYPEYEDDVKETE